MCGGLQENVASEFVSASQAMPTICCSSYLNGLWDERKVAVQLLFWKVLLLGFVRNCMQHPWVVLIQLLLKVQVVQPYKIIDMNTYWKNSRFILSEGLHFNVDDNLSIVVYVFSMQILTLVSEDTIMLPRYVNKFTKIRNVSINVEIAPSCSKRRNSFFKAHFKNQSMPLVPVPDYSADILLGLVYLEEALNHQHNLYSWLFLVCNFCFLPLLIYVPPKRRSHIKRGFLPLLIWDILLASSIYIFEGKYIY